MTVFYFLHFTMCTEYHKYQCTVPQSRSVSLAGRARARPRPRAFLVYARHMHGVVHHIGHSRADVRSDSEAHARTLNRRFAAGEPSDDISKVGIIFKQFDGLEVHPHQPWAACVGAECPCQGGGTCPGRVSAMIASSDLRKRRDRKEIPLPFADRAGISAHLCCRRHHLQHSASFDPRT